MNNYHHSGDITQNTLGFQSQHLLQQGGGVTTNRSPYPHHYSSSLPRYSPFEAATNTVLLAALKEEQEQSVHQRYKHSTNRVLQQERKVHTRKRFALFLKVLIRHLEKSGEIERLYNVKQAVRICNRRRKMGDPLFSSPVESMEIALRPLAGEVQWASTQTYVRYYTNNKNRLLQNKVLRTLVHESKNQRD